MKTLKFIWQSFKLNVAKEFAYRFSFFSQIIFMLANDLIMTVQYVILFSVAPDITAFSLFDCLVFFGMAAGAYGVAHLLFQGIFSIADTIYNGKLDVYLTQPKNVLVNIACSRTNISAVGDILFCFIALAIAGVRWWFYLAAVPFILFSGILFAAVYVCFVSVSFVVKRGDALAHEVQIGMIFTSERPSVIYEGAVKWILLTIIPTFALVTFPVEMMTSFSFATLGIYAGTVIGFVLLAFLLFHLGLRKYSSGNIMGGRE